MTTDTFHTITRSAGTARRRAVLGLSAAGLATTLVGTFGASAKQSAGKKAKKKAKKTCNKQKEACSDQVIAICAPTLEPLACQASLLPCCEECDVSVGVVCTINAFDND